jgi:hypothetical protein
MLVDERGERLCLAALGAADQIFVHNGSEIQLDAYDR